MTQSMIWLLTAAVVTAIGFTLRAMIGYVDSLTELLFIGGAGCAILAALMFYREKRGFY